MLKKDKSVTIHTRNRQYFVGNIAKRRISKRVFKKTKHAKFSEKRTFLTPWYAHVCMCMCAYQEVINTRFTKNLACFVFLKHPFWDSPFCLITDDLATEIFIGKIGISPATMTEIFKFWDNTTNNLTSGQVLERIHARTNNFGVEWISILGAKILALVSENLRQSTSLNSVKWGFKKWHPSNCRLYKAYVPKCKFHLTNNPCGRNRIKYLVIESRSCKKFVFIMESMYKICSKNILLQLSALYLAIFI